MEYTFFYLSIIAVWIVFILSAMYRRPDFRAFIIGIATVAYSLTFDVTLGSYFGLYYYISPKDTNLYIVLSGITLYPLLNILYTLFLPKGGSKALIYSLIWTVAMLIFEYASIITKTVVFTGWKPIPWSIITYFVTYTWIYLLYRYISRRKPALIFS